MGIYEEFILGVRRGKKWHINLMKKDMKLGDKYLIKEGHFEGDLGVWSYGPVQGHLNRLYGKYKSSVPHSSSRRTYFHAKEYEKMSMRELIENESRDIAQARLEGYLLCQILNGYEWPFGNKYYHIGEDKDFVLLKSYWSK